MSSKYHPVTRLKRSTPKKPFTRKKPKTKAEREFENILGPVSIHILDRKSDGSRIVLLGDIHIIEPKCLGSKQAWGTFVYKYLDVVFSSYDQKEFLDFFVEEEFDPLFRPKTTGTRADLIEGKLDHSFLFSTRLFFRDCLQKQKLLCTYPKNIRFHYSDVRQGVIHSSLDEKSKDVVTQLRNIHELWDEKRAVTNKDVRLIETLLTKFKQKDVDFFFKFSKIDKQIKHISDKRYHELFRMYLRGRMDHLEEYTDVVQGVFETFQMTFKAKALPEDELRNEFLGIYESIVSYLVQSLFDIYTLARMVRFQMKRVIIYAGDLHIDIMRDFLLEQMGFNETLSYHSNKEKKNFQCIPRRFIGEPWFPSLHSGFS